ncbi:MAG TPA: hypothetical protein VII92_16975 [Anaerolineae bacterium]
MTIVEKGKERFARVMRELGTFRGYTIKVGYQDNGETSDDGTPTVAIAIFNEFGTSDGKIPPRPFLSSAIDSAHDEIRERFKVELDSILADERSAIQAAKRLGIFGVQLVKQRIRDSTSWAEPNADTTIDRKGSSKPLVDTGEMLNSVTWIVESNGSVVASG